MSTRPVLQADEHGYQDPFHDNNGNSYAMNSYASSASVQNPFASTASLPQHYTGDNHGASRYDRGDDEEKPLTTGSYAGGFYPPAGPGGYAFPLDNGLGSSLPSFIDPSAYGDPYESGGRGNSVYSQSSLTPSARQDEQWRRRQTIKRGKTKHVKLQNGNFIAEVRFLWGCLALLTVV